MMRSFLLTLVVMSLPAAASATAVELALSELKPELQGCFRVAAHGGEGERMAFIAGVADYTNDDMDLRNPGRDAVSIASTMHAFDFASVVSLNQSGADFLDCLDEASDLQKESDAELSLIYFSGHGLQIADQNYLALADIESGDQGDRGLTPLASVVAKLQTTKGSLVVLLDACRDNPFSQSGLSAVGAGQRSLGDAIVGQARGFLPSISEESFSRSLLFAYATAPGAVAYDGDGDLSPFTSAFSRLAPTPGWSLTRVLVEVRNAVGEETSWAQTPWVRHSLDGEIFLKGERDFGQVLERSDQLAAQAEDRLEVGDKYGALSLALQAIPEGLSDDDLALLERANDALVQAYWAPSAQLDAKSNAGAGEQGVALSPDRTRVVTYAQYDPNGDVRTSLWDARNGALIADLGPSSKGSGAVYISSTRIAIARQSAPSRNEIVFDIWDFDGRKLGEVETRCVRSELDRTFCSVHSAASSRNSTLFATSSIDHQSDTYCFDVWDLETPSLLFEACEPEGEGAPAHSRFGVRPSRPSYCSSDALRERDCSSAVPYR